ncbi:enoyl-CoA hydratase domain-containing protein 2, mitochondrial isoform X2 [Nycticebus coucang]|uniref:enoyl-CoA hydratase domain-containing protein 2, mitochondrial isoform X2 n=1 Tax=Nycticebus coucang TaxID=9470 RepID=UPI00234D5C05|nr:enoyl-CoA hydratase domain-containing protein 2, mitochondrial isoform X2 [Nycticebus coucang]
MTFTKHICKLGSHTSIVIPLSQIRTLTLREVGNVVPNHTEEGGFSAQVPGPQKVQRAATAHRWSKWSRRSWPRRHRGEPFSASPGGGGPSATFPACAPMLRVVPRALRLPRPWRPLRARGCASNRAAGNPEIQVRALEGPDQGISEILMNRPHARNALGNVLVSELLDALAQLRMERELRVLIFRSGVKGVFCAGADLKERAQMSEAEVGVFVQRLRGLMDEIAAFPAPTIAAMDGFALGGGLELALACDLRVAAASSAVMGLIETTRGLLPGAGGTQRLPRCLGVALAKELIFTGRRLSGEQAHALGLVNHAVAQNQEGDAAYHRARALAQEILPQVDIASGMAIEGICYAQNIPTQDRLEGMAAFREKRPPRFVGK